MRPPNPLGAGSLLLGLLLTCFGLVILAGAILRETPPFWLNAGGYPVALRDWVRLGFYPGLGVYFLLQGGYFISGFKLLRQNIPSGAILLLASVFNGMLSAVILTVVIWNNVANLLQGLPLHSHAP